MPGQLNNMSRIEGIFMPPVYQEPNENDVCRSWYGVGGIGTVAVLHPSFSPDSCSTISITNEFRWLAIKGVVYFCAVYITSELISYLARQYFPNLSYDLTFFCSSVLSSLVWTQIFIGCGIALSPWAGLAITLTPIAIDILARTCNWHSPPSAALAVRDLLLHA
jgi:hypothetical protein